MEAFGKLVENSFSLLSLSTEHQGLEETTEGSVQALTFELEEGQVGLGYSPAEVIAAEGNGEKDGTKDQAES